MARGIFLPEGIADELKDYFGDYITNYKKPMHERKPIDGFKFLSMGEKVMKFFETVEVKDYLDLKEKEAS